MAQAQNMQLSPTQRMGDSPLVKAMSEASMLDPAQYMNTVLATCFDKEATPEQFAMFLMIAKEHDLNPLTREIYAFQKSGKVMPIVSIDGWLKMINESPEMDGIETLENLDDLGNLVSITCKIYRKDRSKPAVATEYLSECKQDTMPWKKWPSRMLRHKSVIQCARMAFSFAGIYDADEAARMESIEDISGTAYIVEDEPETPAAGIVAKLKAKAEPEDLAPVEDAQEPAPEELVEEEIAVEDIPGLKKGSEVEAPTGEIDQEFVDALEGKTPKDKK